MRKTKYSILLFISLAAMSFAQNTNEREIIDELIEKLEDDHCVDLLISSVSVKKERSEERAFTTYGTSELVLQNGNTLRSGAGGITTNFSDRKVSGYPTKEHLYIVRRNNRLVIKVRFETWGDKTVELKDATIVKREQGYFATGNYYNGRRVVYYTIAIFNDWKRGCSSVQGTPRETKLK